MANIPIQKAKKALKALLTLPRVQEDTLNNRELLSENDRLGMDLPAYIMVLLVTVRHDVSISSSPT